MANAAVPLATVASPAECLISFRTLRDGTQPHPANEIAARMNDAPVNSKPAENRRSIPVNARLGRLSRTGATLRFDQEIHGSQSNSGPKVLQKQTRLQFSGGSRFAGGRDHRAYYDFARR